MIARADAPSPMLQEGPAVATKESATISLCPHPVIQHKVRHKVAAATVHQIVDNYASQQFYKLGSESDAKQATGAVNAAFYHDTFNCTLASNSPSVPVKPNHDALPLPSLPEAVQTTSQHGIINTNANSQQNLPTTTASEVQLTAQTVLHYDLSYSSATLSSTTRRSAEVGLGEAGNSTWNHTATHINSSTVPLAATSQQKLDSPPSGPNTQDYLFSPKSHLSQVDQNTARDGSTVLLALPSSSIQYNSMQTGTISALDHYRSNIIQLSDDIAADRGGEDDLTTLVRTSEQLRNPLLLSDHNQSFAAYSCCIQGGSLLPSFDSDDHYDLSMLQVPPEAAHQLPTATTTEAAIIPGSIMSHAGLNAQNEQQPPPHQLRRMSEASSEETLRLAPFGAAQQLYPPEECQDTTVSDLLDKNSEVTQDVHHLLLNTKVMTASTTDHPIGHQDQMVLHSHKAALDQQRNQPAAIMSQDLKPLVAPMMRTLNPTEHSCRLPYKDAEPQGRCGEKQEDIEVVALGTARPGCRPSTHAAVRDNNCYMTAKGVHRDNNNVGRLHSTGSQSKMFDLPSQNYPAGEDSELMSELDASLDNAIAAVAAALLGEGSAAARLVSSQQSGGGGSTKRGQDINTTGVELDALLESLLCGMLPGSALRAENLLPLSSHTTQWMGQSHERQDSRTSIRRNEISSTLEGHNNGPTDPACSSAGLVGLCDYPVAQPVAARRSSMPAGTSTSQSAAPLHCFPGVPVSHERVPPHHQEYYLNEEAEDQSSLHVSEGKQSIGNQQKAAGHRFIPIKGVDYARHGHETSSLKATGHVPNGDDMHNLRHVPNGDDMQNLRHVPNGDDMYNLHHGETSAAGTAAWEQRRTAVPGINKKRKRALPAGRNVRVAGDMAETRVHDLGVISNSIPKGVAEQVEGRGRCRSRRNPITRGSVVFKVSEGSQLHNHGTPHEGALSSAGQLSFSEEHNALLCTTPHPPPHQQAGQAATATRSNNRVKSTGDYRGTELHDDGGGRRQSRSSRFRGVTKHRRSGRWEAHIWVKDIGRQVYLGGYEQEEHAAEAYDVAVLKVKGGGGRGPIRTNFDPGRYADLTSCMDSISLDELIMAVRRQSQGFSRGSSSFRGVTAHPSGRWESRIGIPGSKHIYLGLFPDEASAARAYDRALVRLRGTNAATNYALAEYRKELGEFHQIQQAMLNDEGRAAQPPGQAEMIGSPDFEHWIKYGNSVPGANMGDMVAQTGGVFTVESVEDHLAWLQTVHDADEGAMHVAGADIVSTVSNIGVDASNALLGQDGGSPSLEHGMNILQQSILARRDVAKESGGSPEFVGIQEEVHQNNWAEDRMMVEALAQDLGENDVEAGSKDAEHII
ncbi:hypothetical protein CEUSTIGMA_g13728.t1 [Chlamydomonas eustigma]|uniref:AP2/ERF domain-containing protein n=1 Tax=Chlamydomonas eustigma TaxID=1157962 RepID=A0A250XTE5_9CHLO|nr:hypothetical protein CEUSTIGMA_g13728.t1 [Chlamydomonas eustigma]|eukprot:GAX86316.1 hypothetical protein CEUSTIGMA_g13728.t1 [Chlamydomonas eustigma]